MMMTVTSGIGTDGANSVSELCFELALIVWFGSRLLFPVRDHHIVMAFTMASELRKYFLCPVWKWSDGNLIILLKINVTKVTDESGFRL